MEEKLIKEIVDLALKYGCQIAIPKHQEDKIITSLLIDSKDKTVYVKSDTLDT